MPHGIGQPVRRKEDARFLLGKGRFTDDLTFPGQMFIHFIRSPHAHARILAIDTAAARSVAGVAAIVTAADIGELDPLICACDLAGRDGRAIFIPPRDILAKETVHFVGELVAAVIADTIDAAKDAADRIVIQYEDLPAVASATRALAGDAPAVWPGCPGNLALHWENRDPAAVDTALEASAYRISVDVVNNRVAPSPLEPRAAAATCDPATGRLTLYAPSQGGHGVRQLLASGVLKLPADQIRMIAHDTGGGFGVRAKTIPEYALLLWAARRWGRPIKWCADRSETFLADYHGRDQFSHAEMGLDGTGRVRALKIDTILNLGAYPTEMGPRVPITSGGRIIPCAYDIDRFYFSVRAAFTHTTPTDTYRGAGAPEANLIMERLMDEAATVCGLDRGEIRRRNLIAPEKLPYRTQMGITIDSGDFAGTMEASLASARWASFAERRRQSESRGRLRGIGLAVFLEAAGAVPFEEMRVRIEKDGSAKIFAGTYSHGQGHDTVYAQLLNSMLGVDFAATTVIQGDTDTMPAHAVGTFGSRSSLLGGVGVKRACDRLILKGKQIAGHLMQCDPDTIDFRAGVFHGVSSSMSLAEVAAAAEDASRLPDGVAPGLDESYFLQGIAGNFPNGCHICEIEVDRETGNIDILGYTATDDCGVVLNPLIVHGQLMGGVVQGIGQSLVESVVFDEASGQILTASFVDYAMPRADHLPHLAAALKEVPCTTNELGIKGAGEGGTIGAPPALVSAVLDALRPLGVRQLDMPLTPEKIWRAMRQAAAAGSRK